MYCFTKEDEQQTKTKQKKKKKKKRRRRKKMKENEEKKLTMKQNIKNLSEEKRKEGTRGREGEREGGGR